MILITGARGTNGIEIVKLLAGSGVPCRALVRNTQKAAALAALPKVGIVGGDLARPETLAPAVEGVDKALLCSSIGPNLVELQGNFIRAAKRAGVRHVVKFSGMDADLNSEVSPVDIRDIAAVAVAVLTGSDHEGEKYVITGPEALTYSAVAERLSEAIGKKVSYVDVPLATGKKTLLDGGAPEWFAEGQAEQFRFRWQGKQSRVTATIAQVAKKKPATFDEFARLQAGYFRDEETAVPTAMPSAH